MRTTPGTATNLRNRAREAMRTAVLALLLLVTVGTSLLMSSGASPATEVSAAPGGEALRQAPQILPRAGTSDDIVSQPWTDAWKVDGLPAWRWRDIDLDVDTSGGLFGAGKIKEIPVIIAEMFFHLANFVWSVLLAVLKFGFEADELLVLGTGAINAGAAFIGSRILLVTPLFLAFALWRIVKTFLGTKRGKGGFVPAFRAAVGFLLMFGALAGTTMQSATAHNNYPKDNDAQLQVAGTLPWAASNLLDLADTITGPLTGPIIGTTGEQLDADESAEQILADTVAVAGNGSSEPISCTKYVATMHDTYANGPNSERTLVVVSRLWESTFLDSWQFSALGGPVSYKRADGTRVNSNIPDRVMCHYAEAVNGSDQVTQQRIARAAYGSAIPDVSAVQAPVFGPFDATTVKERRKMATAWAACTYQNGGWTGHNDFDGAWKDSGTENVYDAHCSKIFANGEDLEDKDLNIFGGDVEEAAKRGDAAHKEQTKAVRAYGIALSGANPGARMLHGVIAMVVAGLFAWSLGFIGLGLVAAMLMAIICLTLAVPAAFALAAAGRMDKATPLFKISLTSLLAESFFTLVLSAIVLLGGLFQNLISAVGVLNPTLSSLANGAAPVGAFLLIRKMMKALGMADIFTASGALTFAPAAASVATGKGQFSRLGRVGKDGRTDMQDMARKMPFLGNKLRKADRYAPTKGNWVGWETRQKRREVNAEEKAAREQHLRERMANRGDGSRYKRIRNRATNARLPIAAVERLKEMATGLGVVSIATMALGPAGFAATAGLGGYRMLRQRRNVGDEPNLEDIEDVEYRAGAVRSGERRGENLRDVNNYVEDTVDRVYADMKATNPSSTPSERVAAGMERAMGDMMGAYAEALTGSREILTPAQIDGLRVSAASSLGYASGAAMTATAGGVVLPVPFSPERARAELSDEQLKSFVHWLPEHDREVQLVRDTGPGGVAVMRPESDEEYASRLFAIGLARGVLHPDGSSVDVLKIHGLDLSDAKVAERVEKWRGGEDDPVLDRLRVSAIDDAVEQRMIQVARTVSAAQSESIVSALSTASAAAATAAATATAAAASAVAGTVGSTPPPPSMGADTGGSEPAAGLGSPAAMVQLMVALNAAKDLLETARRTGENVNEAATKMSTTMERLETNQEKLIEEMATVMVTNLERQMSAQALRDKAFAANFETYFNTGIAQIEGTVDSVRSVIEDFRTGVLPMAEAIERLSGLVESVNTSNQATAQQLAAAVAEQSRQVNSWSEQARRSGAYGIPNSRDAVNDHGSGPIEEGR